MSCTGGPNCVCRCCAGTSVQTPQVEMNRPGLPAISYRVGTWATFKESMLARLSSSDYPALAALQTRDDDDFTIAFLDATSVVLDVLTFYQERLANESYLRTASQLQSLVELSRLIGYTPAPDIAAACYVAFTLKTAPGQAPDPTAPAIIIPQSTQMQSVPAQGQAPQTFETSTDVPAKPDWNALPVQSGIPWVPPGDNSLYLSGTSTQLQLGDALLILGVEREQSDPSSQQWDVVVVNEIQVDNLRQLTYVSWDERLSHSTGDGTSGDPSTWTTAKVFALRQKAALFGNNAPDPNLFVDARNHTKTSLPALIDDTSVPWTWKNYEIASSDQIDLDTTYKKIVVGSWFVLASTYAATRILLLDPRKPNELRLERTPQGSLPPDTVQIDVDATNVAPAPSHVAQLYNVRQASTVSLSKFGLSAKVTELAADPMDPNIRAFSLQLTEVSAQSEQLLVAPQPLNYPLYGTRIDLQDLRPDLTQATIVAITGPRQKLSVLTAPDVAARKVQFIPDNDPNTPLVLNPGDVITLIDPAPLPADPTTWSAAGELKLIVQDASGRPGSVQADLSNFVLAPSSSSDPQVSECALVTVSTVTDPFPHTVLTLQPKSPLQNCYDRELTTVNANVVLATAGQSVSEIMGNGSSSTPNQSFMLKQSPLTYIQAPTASGRQSTLQVQVNGVSWTEVPSLYQQPPSAQMYATLTQSDATTEVIFGDGVEGTTLPTGQNNVQANYRIGSGAATNVAAGSITTLVDHPLGVSGVTNPQPATGGEDPESINNVRLNAPQTVLTLGRAVSITDYQSYAATFAGIAKAYAMWIPGGPSRGVFLTVAGANGADLTGSPTLDNLAASLHNFGNPLVPITVVSFLETLFGVNADVLYDPAYDQPTIKAQVQQTLTQTYSFANRTFGQGVSADEVAALIQSVPGVVAVNVTNLHVLQTSSAGDLASQGGVFTLSKLADWLMKQIVPPPPRPTSPSRICPYLPIPSLTSQPLPAEILVIHPDPSQVILGVMS